MIINESIQCYLFTKMSFTFPTPFIRGRYTDGTQPKSVIDKILTEISGMIRLKPDWQNKINNATIIDKWKNEIKSFNITDKQFQYIIDELCYLSKQGTATIHISPVDGVWESDHLIKDEIKNELIRCVAKLENVPESMKDWHPGSNHQVLDLVHPSLYPYINGVTKIRTEPIPLNLTLESMNAQSKKEQDIFTVDDGYVKKKKSTHSEEPIDYSLSKKYQWLPSELIVNKDGHANILSYINNLHPVEHEDLYNVLEKIFTSFVPLFNYTLTDAANYDEKTTRITVGDWYEGKGIYYNDEDGEGDESTNTVIIPDVESYVPPKAKIPFGLQGRKIQVIFKLANIELTPESLDYPGGSWHVEGMKNENIVASGIYYYYSDNITESRLHFREAIKEPDYEQNDNLGVETVYGLVDDNPLNQDLGYVITKEDRCISFPNIYQHRVEPFTLIDKSKAGHRKILVFFLVDPTHRVLSTENVPPQQFSWCTNECIKEDHLNLTEAKKYREDLMKERKFFIKANTENFFERPFSLCEH